MKIAIIFKTGLIEGLIDRKYGGNKRMKTGIIKKILCTFVVFFIVTSMTAAAASGSYGGNDKQGNKPHVTPQKPGGQSHPAPTVGPKHKPVGKPKLVHKPLIKRHHDKGVHRGGHRVIKCMPFGFKWPWFKWPLYWKPWMPCGR